MSNQQFIITKMGQLGEGVAYDPLTTPLKKSVFIPYTLPNETVLVDLEAGRPQINEITVKSPDRVAPFCPVFTKCGGCAIQHWADAPYRAWKNDLIATALSFVDLHPPIEPLIDAHGAGRRRALLHVRFLNNKPIVGFMEAKSHTIVPFDVCPILVPELNNCVSIAHDLSVPLANLRKPLTIQFTATLSGLDVDIRGSGALTFDARMTLTDCATKHDLARLSIHGDVVMERRQPVLKFGRVPVSIPPGGFTQATALGEETLADLVQEGVGNSQKIADLFCGAGPFALRLAETSRVYAVDSEAKSIASLKQGMNAVQGLKQVHAEMRDLFRRPFLPHELNAYDAVVFDPPRAGAEAQSREIAASKVKCVVGVSCNPASFARDARILVDGGFDLIKVTPVDQFKYSAHIELVGVFKRK